MNPSQVSSKLILLEHLRKRHIRESTLAYDLSRGLYPVLEYCIHSPGCTQRDIAEWFIQSPAAITQTTKKLEAAGMLERRVDRNDMRCNRLYATEKGIEAAELNRKAFRKTDTDMLEGFTKEETELLLCLLTRMVNNLNTEGLEFRPPWKEKEN